MNMENSEIIRTIEKLKTTLTDVESARKQVKDTVEAYSNTQIEIQSYVDTLKHIEESISELIKLLDDKNTVLDQQVDSFIETTKNTCDSVIDQIQEKLTTVSQGFANETNRSINSFKVQIDRFDSSINKVDTLTTKVDEIAKEVSTVLETNKNLQKELHDSQKAQDVVIDSICKSQKDIINTLAHQDEKSENQDKVLDSLSQSLTRNTESISKNIKTNRWIIIISFIILSVLLFIL